MNLEKKRLEYEYRWNNITNYIDTGIVFDNEEFDDMTIQSKYSDWRTLFVDPRYDAELYDMLVFLFDYLWTPSDYVAETHSFMLEDLWLEHWIFGGEKYCNDIDYTAGDVVLYYAKMLSCQTNASFASVIEDMLSSFGIDTYDDLVNSIEGLIHTLETEGVSSYENF